MCPLPRVKMLFSAHSDAIVENNLYNLHITSTLAGEKSIYHTLVNCKYIGCDKHFGLVVKIVFVKSCISIRNEALHYKHSAFVRRNFNS